MRVLQILPGSIVVAYLCGSFHTVLVQKTKCKPLSKHSQRTACLQFLHECIKICQAPLSECAYKDLQQRTKSCTNILFHLFSMLCAGDIPETEALLGRKRDGQTKRFCYVCVTKKNKLYNFNSLPKKRLNRTISTTDTCANDSLERNRISGNVCGGTSASSSLCFINNSCHGNSPLC